MNDDEIRGMFYIVVGLLVMINSRVWALFDELLLFDLDTPFIQKMIITASLYVGIAIMIYGIYRLINGRIKKK